MDISKLRKLLELLHEMNVHTYQDGDLCLQLMPQAAPREAPEGTEGVATSSPLSADDLLNHPDLYGGITPPGRRKRGETED